MDGRKLEAPWDFLWATYLFGDHLSFICWVVLDYDFWGFPNSLILDPFKWMIDKFLSHSRVSHHSKLPHHLLILTSNIVQTPPPPQKKITREPCWSILNFESFKLTHWIWPNGIIFRQPRFAWNSRGPISLPKKGYLGVSKNRGGPPKSSILIGFSGFPLFSPSILRVKSPYFWFNTHQPTGANLAPQPGSPGHPSWKHGGNFRRDSTSEHTESSEGKMTTCLEP